MHVFSVCCTWKPGIMIIIIITLVILRPPPVFLDRQSAAADTIKSAQSSSNRRNARKIIYDLVQWFPNCEPRLPWEPQLLPRGAANYYIFFLQFCLFS